MKKLNKTDKIKRLKDKFYNMENIDISDNNIVNFTCKNCESNYSKTYDYLMRKNTINCCVSCETHKYYITTMKDKYKDNFNLYIDTKQNIKNNKSLINVTCNFCDNTYITTYDLLMRGKDYPVCKYCNDQNIRKIKNYDYFSKTDIENIIQNKYGYDSHVIYYFPNKKKIHKSEMFKLQCKKCGYVFNTSVYYIQKYTSKSGIYCANCNKVKKHDIEDIRKNIYLKDPTVKILYLENASKPILCECTKCHNIQKRSYYNIMLGKKCKYCNGNGTSAYEKEISDFLKENNIFFIEHDRKILKKYNLELDFVIPKYNIAIEFNGLYYHSTESKEKYYHIKKTIYAKKEGYKLIHIFEDEWLNNKDKCKNIILNSLNNNLDLKLDLIEISKKEYFTFNKNIENFYLTYDNIRYSFIKINSKDIDYISTFVIEYDIDNNILIKNLDSNIALSKNGIKNIIEYISKNYNIISNIYFYFDISKYGIQYEIVNNLSFVELKFPKCYNIKKQKRFPSTNDIDMKKIYDCGTAVYIFKNN